MAKSFFTDRPTLSRATAHAVVKRLLATYLGRLIVLLAGGAGTAYGVRRARRVRRFKPIEKSDVLMSEATDSENAELEKEKIRLEAKEIQAETIELLKPYWHRLLFIISVATTALSVLTLILQYHTSTASFEAAKAEVIQTRMEADRLTKELQQKKADLAQADASLSRSFSRLASLSSTAPPHTIPTTTTISGSDDDSDRIEYWLTNPEERRHRIEQLRSYLRNHGFDIPITEMIFSPEFQKLRDQAIREFRIP